MCPIEACIQRKLLKLCVAGSQKGDTNLIESRLDQDPWAACSLGKCLWTHTAWDPGLKQYLNILTSRGWLLCSYHPTGDSQRRLLKAYETEKYQKLDLNSVECKISMSKGIVIFALSVET